VKSHDNRQYLGRNNRTIGQDFSRNPVQLYDFIMESLFSVYPSLFLSQFGYLSFVLHYYFLIFSFLLCHLMHRTSSTRFQNMFSPGVGYAVQVTAIQQCEVSHGHIRKWYVRGLIFLAQRKCERV
jgi:hypothetical protein